MNELQTFRNEELGTIRAVTIEDEPWFVGKDVAEALGYTNSRKVLADHVDGEDKNTVTNRDGNKGNPNIVIINESGLYSLIFSSKLPSAKKFKRWVTNEVLPAIRKTGTYKGQKPQTDLETVMKCAELVANCTNENRQYVLKVLSVAIPGVDEPATPPTPKDKGLRGFYYPQRMHNLSGKSTGTEFDFQKLDEILKERRMSNGELGKKADLYPNNISRYRRGLTRPGTDARNALCDALELPHGYFDK